MLVLNFHDLPQVTDGVSSHGRLEGPGGLMFSGKLCIIIPAYNAERHLPTVLERIPDPVWRHVHAVYIVDDGSTDGTAAVIRRAESERPCVRGIFLAANGGYGRAMKAGLKRAQADRAAAAVCLHADGQYAPEEIPRLLAALERRGLDLLQGSRLASGTAVSGGMPRYKLVAGLMLRVLENAVFGLHMTDYHSGYLVYGGGALARIPFERLSDSFDFDLEVIAACRAAGLAVGEEPVPTHYGDEESHLNPVCYGFRVLGCVFRYLTGHYHRLVRPESGLP